MTVFHHINNDNNNDHDNKGGFHPQIVQFLQFLQTALEHPAPHPPAATAKAFLMMMTI